LLPGMNLDNRTYEQIVQEARRSIPRLIAEWTDENAHDPGITFLELFAWVTEIQQYYLNRITERSMRKFLAVLGTEPREQTCSATVATIGGVSRTLALPVGTKLVANDQIFETSTPALLLPFQIARVLVHTETGSYDASGSNQDADTAYCAFGPGSGEKGRLYVGFDEPLPVNTVITLYFSLSDQEPVPLRPVDDNFTGFVPPAQIRWKCYGIQAGRVDWQECQVVEDTTYSLTQSGFLKLTLPCPMEPDRIFPATDKARYWLCGTMEHGKYDLPPKIRQISLNTVPVVHQNTHCTFIEYDGTGEEHQQIVCAHYLAFYGQVTVQVKCPNGLWKDWRRVDTFAGLAGDDHVYTLSRNETSKQIEIRFGDGREGAIPMAGKAVIRLLLAAHGFNPLIGKSNGLPQQIISLPQADWIGSSLQIQVGKREPVSGEFLWEDWFRVSDFDASRAEDHHFVWLEEKGQILFGNDEAGRIPEAADFANIRLIRCQSGGGVKGNIKPRVINQIVCDDEDFRDLEIANPVPAKGGQDRESLKDAVYRVQHELSQPVRAVTNEDYEALVMQTPGVRVARVKALPLYKTDLQGYPENTAPGHVTIVAVPCSEEKNPVPSSGFLQTIRNYLEPYRLLSTQLHVVPPEYVKVSIRAHVVVDHQLRSVEEIRKVLEQYLHPLDSDGAKGWSFGRTVYKADLYEVLNRIKGVLYVEDVWMSAEGKGFRILKNGDIVIPPHGLVYSGEHDIRIRTMADR